MPGIDGILGGPMVGADVAFDAGVDDLDRVYFIIIKFM